MHIAVPLKPSWTRWVMAFGSIAGLIAVALVLVHAIDASPWAYFVATFVPLVFVGQYVKPWWLPLTISPHGLWVGKRALSKPVGRANGDFTPWDEVVEIRSADWGVKVFCEGEDVWIDTAFLEPRERTKLIEVLRDARRRYRQLQRGSDIDRPRMERLARRAAQ